MLILGIGNVLMGDEGIGVHVVRAIQQMGVPEGVECMDGGTGGFHLLGPIQEAERVVLIDATIDGARPGTVRRLRPRFSSDYPKTLTAHDIGLKDLLDAFYLMGDERPDVTLFAVSIEPLQGISAELGPDLADKVDEIARLVLEQETLDRE